jgi:coenzyme F420-reducing hydrogenase delta subunit
LFDDYCREQVEQCSFDSLLNSSKHGIISLSRRSSAFSKIVAKMMLKRERCWVVWILFSSVTQIVQMITFNQDVLGQGKW